MKNFLTLKYNYFIFIILLCLYINIQGSYNYITIITKILLLLCLFLLLLLLFHILLYGKSNIFRVKMLDIFKSLLKKIREAKKKKVKIWCEKKNDERMYSFPFTCIQKILFACKEPKKKKLLKDLINGKSLSTN